MKRLSTPAAIAVAIVIALCQVAASAPIPGIFTYHSNNARDGANLNETILTPANVNSSTFGKLFSRKVDGYVYAEPLYVNSVEIPRLGAREVVYVATEHDSVYAFDATGAIARPLWKVSFRHPKKKIRTVPAELSGTNDLAPEIGITGTPVIDPASNTLYVSVATMEGKQKTFFHRLHALDLATGQEKFGGPVEINALQPGTGGGSDNGNVAFAPMIANQRSGLALNNGIVYVAFASHGDRGDYHGWIFGYDAATLELVSTFLATPNGSLGGIWMAGGAPMIDADGNVFVVTGNGTFNADKNGVDYGDSVLKLGPTDTSNLDVIDFFTPFDQQALEFLDIDLGSSGVIALPDQDSGPQHLAFTGGKEGTLYLIDRDNMGHFNTDNDSQIVQSIMGQTANIFSTPAYFNGMVYVGAIGDNLKAFSLSNGALSTEPVSATARVFGFTGATPTISANGSQDGIVWAIRNESTAVLYAYDATDLGVELYSSSQAKRNRDKMTAFVKFTVPTVANGRVFVGSKKRLTVFGLLRKK